jgi:hypothetical protein
MDSQTSILVTTTMYILVQSPLLIIWLVGIVLALKNWSHYPKASMFALIGFVTLILETFLFSSITMVLPHFLSQNGVSASSMSFYFSALGIVRSLFGAISWSLIVAAIFTQRYKKEQN